MTIDEKLTPVEGATPEEAVAPQVGVSNTPEIPAAVETAVETSVAEVATEPAPVQEASAPALDAIAEVSAPAPIAVAEDPTPAPEVVDDPTPAPEVVDDPVPAPEVIEDPVPAPVVAAEVPAPPQIAPRPVIAGTTISSDPNDADLFEAAMRSLESGEVEATDSGVRKLSKGDRVEATIIQVDRDKVFVDLGTKAEGIIPLGELTEENIESAEGRFNVGDKINVVVLKPEGAESNAIVSKKRADFEKAWDRVEEAFKTQELIAAQVIDRVKGGLVVDVGVRGFVPATHVGNGKLRNIEKYVGNALQLKVIEIDRERKKVVLSNRQAEEEKKAAAKENIFGSVKPGDTLEGTVRRLTDYGAFIDLGGVDGLLHISEMSWMRITHPKEMFKEGQKIPVMVLRLDPSIGKISLGHRQVLPDPWNLISDNYKIGQTLTVIVNRIVTSGAFIKLAEGAEAFLPVSEMSARRIKKPQDVIEENQEVEVVVLDLRPDERRMVLSMRAVGMGGVQMRPVGGGPGGYDRNSGGAGRGGKRPMGGRDRVYTGGEVEEVGGSRRGFVTTGGATIGERLGMLKGILKNNEGAATEEAPKPEVTEKE